MKCGSFSGARVLWEVFDFHRFVVLFEITEKLKLCEYIDILYQLLGSSSGESPEGQSRVATLL